MSHRNRNLAFAGILFAIMAVAGVLAAPITVSPTQDAQGSVGALSGTGDASAADDCSYVPVPVTLPGCTAGGAGSVTGNATACSASGYGTTPCLGGATSLIGSSDACSTADPSAGVFPNCVGIAASVLGDADACGSTPQAYTDVPGCAGVAASGTGNADACADAEDSHWSFGWFACLGVAASATGDAQACGTNETITFEDSRCIGVAASGCDVGSVVCTRELEASVPSNVTLDEDADGDGFPASVTIGFSRLVVDGNAGTANATHEQDLTLAVDPDDADADVPVAQELRVRLPTSAAFGPDNDRDGLPAYASLEESTLVIRRGEPNATLEPRDGAFARVTLDANDGDPNAPIASVVRASYPSNVTIGPDADRDGVPASVTIEFSTLTIDRRDPANFTTARDPARDVRIRPDADDANPNVPLTSSVSASFPSGVALGPDADGDGLPATITIESSRLTIDRRDATNATPLRDPAGDRTIAIDPDDADFDNNDVVGLGLSEDAEGDVVAFSLMSDAQACGDSIACLAVSGSGTARGYLAASALGDAQSCDLNFLCTAVSGTGDARANDLAASGLGDAEAGYLALSGAGDADGAVPLSVLGRCNGTACYSLAGDGYWLGVATGGEASGIVAVSPDGRASGGLVGASATGEAEGGLIAASGTGDAESGLVAASGTGDATAPVAMP